MQPCVILPVQMQNKVNPLPPRKIIQFHLGTVHKYAHNGALSKRMIFGLNYRIPTTEKQPTKHN